MAHRGGSGGTLGRNIMLAAAAPCVVITMELAAMVASTSGSGTSSGLTILPHHALDMNIYHGQS